MKEPIVHIVIVSYNGKKILEISLPTLINQEYKNYKIFIAGNNSTDGTEEWLKDNYPHVYYIKQEHNIGMAAMNDVLTWPKRQGIEEEADYIFVAGWDLKFEPRTLAHSVMVMEDNQDVGILGYEVIGLFEWADPKQLESKTKEWTHSELYDTNWVPGACSFYRKKLLDEIGFLDPVYFAYCEEDDIQFRVRQTGFRTVIINTYCWQDVRIGVIPKANAAFLNYRNTIRYHTKTRGVLFGLRVALSLLNTACNPFVKIDLSNRVNQRKRPFGALLNLKIWLHAFFWNIWNLSSTLRSRLDSINKIKKGRIYFNMLNNNNSV